MDVPYLYLDPPTGVVVVTGAQLGAQKPPVRVFKQPGQEAAGI